jgi:unsaturated rhamnogalacturonyl hydrolase
MIWLLACTAGEPEPIDLTQTARALAERGSETWPAEDLPFDWMQTVWAYGVWSLHEAWTQDYAEAWMADNLYRFEGEDPASFHSSDSMSPALLASLLMAEDPSLELTSITDAGHAYLAVAPKTEAGAYEHWGPGSVFGEVGEVWIDSQFMIGMFLLAEHDRTGDPAYLDTWAEQYELFSMHCRDEGDQLYRHAWSDPDQANIPLEAVYWNRGNSWVLVSAAEYLARVEPGSAGWERIQPLFEAHAAAAVAYQSEDGLWHTVLNHPEDSANYTETSGSALIGHALSRGIEAGALEGEAWQGAVDAAALGVLERVDEDTLVVEGTSFGTNPGDYDDYVGIIQLDDIILGVGSVVLFLNEVGEVPN